MNNDKRFIGTFHHEKELYSKIQDLKSSGTADENIYILAKDDKELQMVRRRTDAEVKTTDESLMDKFMNFMTGENHIHHMLDDLGLSKEEKDRYTQDLHNGGMVLYVDEGEAGTLYRNQSGRYGTPSTGIDPNLGANVLAPGEASQSMTTVNTQVADPDPSEDSTLSATDGNLHGNYNHTTSRLEKVETERVRGQETGRQTIEEMPETMKVHEEKLQVDKQAVQKGEIELEKNVEEKRVQSSIPVEHEEVSVERRPVNDQFVNSNHSDPTETATFDNETIRVPITEEKVEVTKKPVVTEEIVINKKRVTDTEKVDETLRREDVEVNRRGDTRATNADIPSNNKGMDTNNNNW